MVFKKIQLIKNYSTFLRIFLSFHLIQAALIKKYSDNGNNGVKSKITPIVMLFFLRYFAVLLSRKNVRFLFNKLCGHSQGMSGVLHVHPLFLDSLILQ